MWGYLLAVTLTVTLTTSAAADWAGFGNGVSNWRYTAKTCITSKSKFTKKWQFTTTKPVSATPTVCGGKVFFPDDAGFIYALDALSGKQLWKKSLKNLIPEEAGGVYSRNAPGTDAKCKTLVFGTKPAFNNKAKFGAYVFAVDAASGAFKWKTRISNNPYGQVTQSATVYNNSVYVGTSSSEETSTGGSGTCCTFRGRFVKLDLGSGVVKWSKFMTIDNKMDKNGWSGCAIWGSAPAIDTARQLVVVTTGNNYKTPQSHVQCLKNAGRDPKKELACNPKGNYVDAFVAFDLNTGKVVWSRTVSWDYYAYYSGLPFCNGFGCWLSGPDRDFAQGAVFVDGKYIAGQKNGMVYAVNATGKTAWKYSTKGQLWFGSATDGKRFYTASTSGLVYALDVATGQAKWTAQVGTVFGPVSVANDVLFVPLQKDKKLVWLDASTGVKLGEFANSQEQFSGPSINNNMIYFGNGYFKNFQGGNCQVTALQADC